MELSVARDYCTLGTYIWMYAYVRVCALTRGNARCKMDLSLHVQVNEVLNREILSAANSIQFNSDSFFSSNGLQTLKDFSDVIGNIEFDGRYIDSIYVSVSTAHTLILPLSVPPLPFSPSYPY